MPPCSSTIEWITWQGGNSFKFSLTKSRVLCTVLLKARDPVFLEFPWLFIMTSSPSVKMFCITARSWGDVDEAWLALIIDFRKDGKLLLLKSWRCTMYNTWLGGQSLCSSSYQCRLWSVETYAILCTTKHLGVRTLYLLYLTGLTCLQQRQYFLERFVDTRIAIPFILHFYF